MRVLVSVVLVLVVALLYGLQSGESNQKVAKPSSNLSVAANAGYESADDNSAETSPQANGEDAGDGVEEIEEVDSFESSLPPDHLKGRACYDHVVKAFDGASGFSPRWFAKCLDLVPEGYEYLCEQIQTSESLKCAEFSVENKLGFVESVFSTCAQFATSAEVECLANLKPRDPFRCLGVAGEFDLKCRKLLGQNMQRLCQAIDNAYAYQCLENLESRGWSDEITKEYCPLFSEDHELKCLKEVGSPKEVFSCYPKERGEKMVVCRRGHRPTTIKVEKDKKVVINLEKGALIGGGILFLEIDPSIREIKEPIELISAAGIYGAYDRVRGLGSFRVEYRDNQILLREKNENQESISDLRSDQKRGALKKELREQHCLKTKQDLPGKHFWQWYHKGEISRLTPKQWSEFESYKMKLSRCSDR